MPVENSLLISGEERSTPTCMPEEDGVQVADALIVATVVFAQAGALLPPDEVAGVQVAIPLETVAVLTHDGKTKEKRIISARMYSILFRTEYRENTSALLEMKVLRAYTPRHRIIAQL